MTAQNGFAIDHEHSTNKIRGLLCNLALGHFGDDPELCLKASSYLREFSKCS